MRVWEGALYAGLGMGEQGPACPLRWGHVDFPTRDRYPSDMGAARTFEELRSFWQSAYSTLSPLTFRGS